MDEVKSLFDESEERINERCIFKRTSHKLIIQKDESEVAKENLKAFFFIIGFLIFIMLIVRDASIISYTLIFGLLASFSLIDYLSKNHQLVEWVINRSLGRVQHQQIKPLFKEFRNFSLSEVKQLQYGVKGLGKLHYLAFIIEPSKKLDIFMGTEDECKQLGAILQEFLRVPTNHTGILKFVIIISLNISIAIPISILIGGNNLWSSGFLFCMIYGMSSLIERWV